MSRVCEVCGKGSAKGGSKIQRGKAKKQGGVGRQTTSHTKRRFKPNIQKIRVLVDGSPKTMKVCTKCIKSNRVTKYVK
jgi:large subunit ribosomal protein L28